MNLNGEMILVLCLSLCLDNFFLGIEVSSEISLPTYSMEKKNVFQVLLMLLYIFPCETYFIVFISQILNF